MLIKRLLSGLLALFAFPTLSVLTVGLAGSAVFVVIVSFLRQLGMVNIDINIVLFEVPKLLSIPVGLLFGAAFFYLARQSWRLLRASYHTVKFAIKV